MLLLITYDVNTTTLDGEKRLRKVAKLCEKYGIRVQNSVFEVLVDGAQLVKLKAQLEKLIDQENDSVRFYKLGNSYEHKIETMGKTPLIQTGGPMIL
ncbi:CRISPR-associated endonuclease Cas2 [Evtepia sp.]|uniref:CRISPR-associated endonuclease Cas2 n=1 Tax=Evtepia sp. TaxID=2773933 RepID=UPI002A83D845|nr:CRISPR-associated endonuclease Cas2 [Evtepia sp.]MDY4430603.1 CRISPR-associated endonuclease Cas2 [Evtepia sp.]